MLCALCVRRVAAGAVVVACAGGVVWSCVCFFVVTLRAVVMDVSLRVGWSSVVVVCVCVCGVGCESWLSVGGGVWRRRSVGVGGVLVGVVCSVVVGELSWSGTCVALLVVRCLFGAWWSLRVVGCGGAFVCLCFGGLMVWWRRELVREWVCCGLGCARVLCVGLFVCVARACW